MVFFALWWAWMNFTWFASAYDTDDITAAQLAWVAVVLVPAAGLAGVRVGYGHYFISASAAAIGAGLGVAVDRVGAHADVGVMGAGLAVATPQPVLWIGARDARRGEGRRHTRQRGTRRCSGPPEGGARDSTTA